MLFCTMFMSENIVENALRFNLRAHNFSGGGHATRPRQGTPTLSKPATPLFHTANEGLSCFPPKIKLLDRTLTTQSQWAERR